MVADSGMSKIGEPEDLENLVAFMGCASLLLIFQCLANPGKPKGFETDPGTGIGPKLLD